MSGDKMLLLHWSANRDERHLSDPESFDVRRDPNPHLGFGAPGPHVCLGMHLGAVGDLGDVQRVARVS
jgi:methyl-branched lipid omega-hydroxylase